MGKRDSHFSALWTRLPHFLHPKLGVMAMTNRFNEWGTLLCRQSPDLEVLSRKMHSTLCFNACSGAALSLKGARGAGEPEEDIWGSTAAWRCWWLPAGTSVTERFRRRWHVPVQGIARGSATGTPPSAPAPGLMLLLLNWDILKAGRHFNKLDGLHKGRVQIYLDKLQRDTGEEEGLKKNWEKQRCICGLVWKGSCCKLSCKDSKQLWPFSSINRRQRRGVWVGSKGRGRY